MPPLTPTGRASRNKYKATDKGKVATKRHRKALLERRRESGALREYQRQRAIKARASLQRLVFELKSVPCADCGATFDPVCMDFDHRPGEMKRDKVATLVSNGQSHARVLAEIAKCDVVCSNCHRIRTHRTRNHREACGTFVDRSAQLDLIPTTLPSDCTCTPTAHGHRTDCPRYRA